MGVVDWGERCVPLIRELNPIRGRRGGFLRGVGRNVELVGGEGDWLGCPGCPWVGEMQEFRESVVC